MTWREKNFNSRGGEEKGSNRMKMGAESSQIFTRDRQLTVFSDPDTGSGVFFLDIPTFLANASAASVPVNLCRWGIPLPCCILQCSRFAGSTSSSAA